MARSGGADSSALYTMSSTELVPFSAPVFSTQIMYAACSMHDVSPMTYPSGSNSKSP